MNLFNKLIMKTQTETPLAVIWKAYVSTGGGVNNLQTCSVYYAGRPVAFFSSLKGGAYSRALRFCNRHNLPTC